ncbi:MAG: hypothetical protein IH801_08320, partial [Nitrospinae bacterium]|nr:hypothetical protein [Nitrospinota bacterium]
MVTNEHQRLFSAPIRALGRLSASAPSWPRRRGAWIALVAAFAIAAAWPTPALTAGESSLTSKTLVLDDGRKVELIVGPVFEGDVSALPTAKRWAQGDPVREASPLLTSPLGDATLPQGAEPKLDPLLELPES